MASNWTVCGICDFKHVTKPSVVWCSECDEGLCDDCKEHHSISKASREHDTVPIGDYQNLPTEVLQVAQSCRKHNQKYQIFCKIHDCPCCKKCVIDEHNECKEFVDIDDVIKNKDKQAQLIIPVAKSIDDLTLTLVQSINTYSQEVRGCTMLPDGRMVFTCYHPGYVTIVNQDGSKDFEIKSGNAFDVVYLDNDIIAVTCGVYSKTINLIDTKLKKVKKTICVDSSNEGMVLKDKDLIYCGRRKGLRKISLSDESVCTIINPKLCDRSYVTTFKDSIIYTDYRINTVTCTNLQGQVNWKFKVEGILKYPFGVSVDHVGNVYAIGHYSCNVVVISSDGQRHREILSCMP
ncbi:unnamed protein product [Mytilus edulis]|uniref:B box-type domain-containing protein n=1 Tax=Mytilus edulis TaxID=6550 RepID=A0A8S3V9I4_MYTED|nr:unnamed protein product [Mytilus edulis]